MTAILTLQAIATMTRKIIFSLILLSGFILFNRCSNEVDLYADYQDITIVYSILDYTDDTAWIKITRAYSGPGDALLMAQNPDSSNYPNKLNVSITGRKQGEDLQSVTFDTLTIKDKKPGDSIFYYPNQLMYYAKTDLDVDADYTLSIINGDKEIISQTPLIKNFNISEPRNRINFDSDNVKFEWTAPINGKRFEVYYVFNYQELSPGNADTLDKKMQWFVTDVASEDVTESEKIEVTGYDGNNFFTQLENNLTNENEEPGIKRWAGEVDVYVASGTQELQNYISINSAEGSLLEEVPIYTNIENGTGLFAARHTALKNVDLSTASVNRLVSMDLGFLLPQ